MELSELSISDLFAAVGRIKEKMAKLEPNKIRHLDEWNDLASKKCWINGELDKRINQLHITSTPESPMERVVKDIFPALNGND